MSKADESVRTRVAQHGDTEKAELLPVITNIARELLVGHLGHRSSHCIR